MNSTFIYTIFMVVFFTASNNTSAMHPVKIRSDAFKKAALQLRKTNDAIQSGSINPLTFQRYFNYISMLIDRTIQSNEEKKDLFDELTTTQKLFRRHFRKNTPAGLRYYSEEFLLARL